MMVILLVYHTGMVNPGTLLPKCQIRPKNFYQCSCLLRILDLKLQNSSIAHSNIYGSAFFLIFQYRKVENRVSTKVTEIEEFQAKVSFV